MNLFGLARFVCDPELKQTTNSCVCKFRLVFSEYVKKGGEKKEIPCFLSFEAWDKGAETIFKYFKKGDRILVRSATPRQNVWEKDGQKHERIEFRLNDFGFIESAKNNEQPDNSKPEKKETPQSEQEVPF